MTLTSAKKALEQVMRDRLWGSPLFPAARSAYQFMFARRMRARRKSLLSFYRPFVPVGSLVFDIGANVGMYSDMFLELGARAVAVEPNPALCPRLRLMANRSDLKVESCAVGAQTGTASMYVCAASELSTLSERWRKTAGTSLIHGHAKWDEPVEVAVTTLDVLAAKYGLPAFVKIDVEGFEDRVLAGMSFAPAGLSFEFHFGLFDVAATCLRHPILRENYRFNYTVGVGAELRLPTWVGASDIEEVLFHLDTHEEFGDIFCQRIDVNTTKP